MNIGAGGMQQSPLFMALQSQNMAGAQQEQLSEEERRRRQMAIQASLAGLYEDIKKPSPMQPYLMSGAQGSGGRMW